jgi:hypothetical protein
METVCDWKEWKVEYRGRKETACAVLVQGGIDWRDWRWRTDQCKMELCKLMALISQSSNRVGSLPMRSLCLSTGMYSALKIEQVSFSVSLKLLDRIGVNEGRDVADLGGSNFECEVGENVQLEWIVTNKRGMKRRILMFLDTPIQLFFRTQPLQDHYNGEIDLEDKSQILWLGSLQHLLPEIDGGGSARVVMPLMLLNTGQWKVLYSAEVVGGGDVYWNSEHVFLKCVK